MHCSGAHYNGAGGIHGTLITRSAHNTIIDYDTVPEYKWRDVTRVIRVLCLAHQCRAEDKCGKIDEDGSRGDVKGCIERTLLRSTGARTAAGMQQGGENIGVQQGTDGKRGERPQGAKVALSQHSLFIAVIN